MQNLASDVRLALRLMRRSPGFTLAAVAAIALGIGANTAIFSVINAVLLQPLPYPDSDRIVVLMNSSPQFSFPAASVTKYNNWRRQTAVLQDVAAYDTGGPGINVSGGDRPEQLRGIHVSHEFFRLFGAGTALGRTFTPQEDRPGGGNLVVLSHALWQRRFGGDRDVLGKTLAIGGQAHSIIGVVAPDFSFDPAPDLYLPFQADPNSNNQGHYFRVAGRLKPGVSVDSANAALALAAEEFKRTYPTGLGAQDSFSVMPMRQLMVRNVRPALLVLLGAVACVLLIACANVANLLLARSTRRAREMAIRSALGAGRSRIVRQLLTESLLLSLFGGAAGLFIGVFGVKALLALSPGNLPRLGPDAEGFAVDWMILGFTLAVSIFTGILFGFVPALQAARTDLNTTLKETGSRTGSGLRQNKARSVLVVAEMALAVLLLIGAGLLIRTFAALHSVAPGFNPRNVLAMDTSLAGGKYEQTAAITQLSRVVLERIRAIPGVESAAATSYLPLQGGLGLGFVIDGRPLTDGPDHGGAGWNYVTADFFKVFEIPLTRGRAFTDRDDAAAPQVVVINEAMARRYWKDENPIGHRLIIGSSMGPEFKQPAREIIGVVGDARDGGLNSDPQPAMFIPLAQVQDTYMVLNNRFMPLNWVMRTKVAPFSVAQPVERVFQESADLAVAHLRSMDQILQESTARDRFNTMLLGTFAFFALLLASIGLYGLIAYSVDQRTLEFGIRLAMGAEGPALRNMIIGQAMLLAAVGIAVGLAAAFGLTRLMASLLFGVAPTDPLIFALVAGVLALVALMAAYIPARRAVKIDPVIALRYE
jgi:putative ABC transport system permease protein